MDGTLAKIEIALAMVTSTLRDIAGMDGGTAELCAAQEARDALEAMNEYLADEDPEEQPTSNALPR
jgi:hypothetical protein